MLGPAPSPNIPPADPRWQTWFSQLVTAVNGFINTGYGYWQTLNQYVSQLLLGPGNSVVNVFGGAAGSTLELRFCALGNTGAYPYWRILFNGTGGIEIQNATDATYATCNPVLSLSSEAGISFGIDGLGINIDTSTDVARIAIRDAATANLLGEIRAGNTGVGSGSSLVISAVNAGTGVMEDCMYLDPSADSNNPLNVWVAGGWHKMTRTLTGGINYATLP
jgi:hypothetical protein